jgi:glucan 1,4-alpha-glucosidase
MKRILLCILVFSVIIGCAANKKSYSIKSPDEKLHVHMNVENALSYRLTWKGKVIVEKSTLSIVPGKKIKITNHKIKLNDSSWNPVWGQFVEIRDHYKELVLSLDIEGVDALLFVRVYNGGVGFRFELKNSTEIKNAELYCEYNLNDNDQLYWYTGEYAPFGPVRVASLIDKSESQKIRIPVVVENSPNVFLSLIESDLYSANGFNVMNLNFDQRKNILVSSNPLTQQVGKIITPWRVILVGESAGDLVVSTVPQNLAAPCKIDDTSWIKPGKSLWDWRVMGYTAPDGFVYDVNTESFFRFIDFASEKGIEYFLIDHTWFKGASYGKFNVHPKVDLVKVLGYARQKKVDMLLYYDRNTGEYGDDKLFSYFNSLGASGTKYGFMAENVNFTRNAIKASAKNKLLINFHDSPVPFTGVSRTFPNAITRENCHAQMDRRTVFTPETFINMALVYAVQGPLDMSNGSFDIAGINKGDRLKGPKDLNTFLTTAVSEAARTLIIFTGLAIIPDAPEAYNAKADLFEFIEKLPIGKWDESIVLNSKLNEYITTARRAGDDWFVGSAVSQEGGSLDIKLDFLKAGIIYDVTYYEDAPDTHCRTNPETYQIRKGKVKKGDVVKAVMAPGGGHCMWIRP